MSPSDEESEESRETGEPPALQHSPPSPWALPPFGAPVPGDTREEPEDPDAENTWSPQPPASRTGRRPYGDSQQPPPGPPPRHSRPYSRPTPPDPDDREGDTQPYPRLEDRPVYSAGQPAYPVVPAPTAARERREALEPPTWREDHPSQGAPAGPGSGSDLGAASGSPADLNGPHAPAQPWAAFGEDEPQALPRRIVTRPDKLVASGEPRRIRIEPEILAEPEAPRRRPAARSADPPDAPDAPPVLPPVPATPAPTRPPTLEHQPRPVIDVEPHEPYARPEEMEPEPDVPVVPQRIGRPPGGRPARPDVLVALGPPRGGRHQRRGVRVPRRRSRLRFLAMPVLVAVSAIAAAALILFVLRVVNPAPAQGIKLAVGDGQSGDSAFQAPGLPGNGSRQVLTSVASSSNTIVAVGSDTTSAVARPLFIVSVNGGKDWELGDVSGPPGYEPAPGSPGRVTGGDGKWLAAGTDIPGPEGRGLWTSPNGRSWTAVDPARLTPFWAQDRVTDVARTTTGFAAVGVTMLKDGTLGAVAWISPDGQGWTRIDTPRIGTSDKIRGIQAVVAKGDQVVALADPGQGTATVILRSEDGGRTWLRTAAALPGIRPEVGALAATKDGFVLVPTGQRTGGDGVQVYCSPDGAAWSTCGTIGPLSPQGSGVRGLASSDAGIAAVTEEAWEEYAVFTSSTGRSWDKSADLGTIPGTLRAVTLTNVGTLVAGGDKRGAGDVENQLVLMTAAKGDPVRAVPLEAVAGLNRLARNTASVLAAGSAFVAVGSANGDAGIWTSGNNGANWRAVSSDWLGGQGRQTLDDVAYGPKGWLAVGSTMPALNATTPLLVTSSDGKAWRPGPQISVGEGHLHVALSSVAAGKKGYVLVGSDQTASGVSPALWFSPDARRFTRAGKLPAGGAGVRLYDVAATPDGFVAVGGSGPSGREAGVVWTSKDGTRWTDQGRVVPEDAGSAGLRHVVAMGDSVIAIGRAVTGKGARPFSAVSGDGGDTWEYSWLPADSPAVVLDLTASERAVVAVGAHGAASAVDSTVWASEDGLTWTRQPLVEDGLGGPGAQWLSAVTISGERVTAIGRSATRTADNITIWRSSLTAGDR